MILDKKPQFILALDQGTTSSRSVLYDLRFNKIDFNQKEFPQYFPQPGWVEHDAEEIWKSQFLTLKTLVTKHKLNGHQVAAIGITNQRETIVAWDKQTGKPLAKAIVWQDRRTSAFCEKLKQKGLEKKLRAKTGLLLDPYFSASKMHWLLQNNTAVKSAAKNKRLAFGNIDSWLIFKLTEGGSHVTDVSNASRTQLMDLQSLKWDKSLLNVFAIPENTLPQILASDAHFGDVALKNLPSLSGIPIHGVAGDQQAALFGQRCFYSGNKKNTYGTGCFLLRNIGSKYVSPSAGILGTVAWKVQGQVTYAHEGAVLVGGAAIQFLRDQWQMIHHASESETLAQSLNSNEGVYFVPAFAGLGTPYWDSQARGLITGLTRGTTKAHLVRAALESIAYQSQDLISALGQIPRVSKSGKINTQANKNDNLHVDGGATQNNFLMQFQANIFGNKIYVSLNAEVTARGAAMLAALGCGAIKNLKAFEKMHFPEKIFTPKMSAIQRKLLLSEWQQAVMRART